MNTPAPPRFLSRWDLAALAGALALAVLYVQVLPMLPDPVPTHFDALGRANGWTPKAQLPWLVFGTPAFLWAVLFGIGATAALLPQDSGGARALAVHPLRGLMGLGLCLVMGGCLLLPLRGTAPLFAGLLGLALCTALGAGFLVRDARRALAQAAPSRHYRWGVFYVNADDPRLWVPKRLGLGWTLNFARPAAAWVLILLAAGTGALLATVLVLVRR